MEYRVFGSTRNWPLTTARSRTSDQIYHRVKRCTDLVLATLMLVALLPVLLIAAIAIVLDSPGPIIFRQKRVGIHISFHHGKVTYELCEFTLLKFRTMHHHADTLVHQRFVTALIHNDRSRVAAIQAGPAAINKLQHDGRITRVGRILRRTSIDELPQLWNVLRGDMSLVGPRPALPYEVVEYQPHHRRRLEALPGCVGLWQVSGWHMLSFEEMIELDTWYVDHRSVWLDLLILVQTIPAVLSGHGGG